MKLSMKLPEKTLSLVSISIIMLIYSCSNEDTPTPIIDSEKPVITIIAPTDLANPLRATVTVKAEATDNTGIAKVEVFVDGSSIASATTSPVEVSWDTQTVADGSHVIKIVAEDTEGNEEEKSLTVDVKNILFTFPIGVTYLGEFDAGWVFVSDEKNEVIGVKEMKNDETITVETPADFTLDKRYSVHILDYYFQSFGAGSSFLSSMITSYLSVRPGNFPIDYVPVPAKPSVGNHTLFISGSPLSSVTGGTISKDARRIFFSGPTPALADYVIPLKSELTKSPADIIYFAYNNEDESNGLNKPLLFYRTENTSSNTEDIVDYASLAPMNFITADFTDAQSSEYSIRYLPSSGDYSNSVFLYSQRNDVTPNELHIHYPDITFPEYITTLGYRSSDAFYTHTTASAQINNVFKKINANINSFTYGDNKIAYEATGSFIHVGARASTFVSDGFNTAAYDWFTLSPNDSKGEILIPEIPLEIFTKYPDLSSQEFVFNSLTLYDNEGNTSYDEVIDSRFSGASLWAKSIAGFSVTKESSLSGGRKRLAGRGRLLNEWLLGTN